MTTIALATLISNLLTSWRMNPGDPVTVALHAKLFQRFDGADVRLFRRVVDNARLSPPCSIDTLAEMLRVESMPENSQATTQHRPGRKYLPVRISTLNDALSALRHAGTTNVRLARLARAMRDCAAQGGFLVDDAPPHELLTIDAELIAPWLGQHLSPPPEVGDLGTFQKFV